MTEDAVARFEGADGTAFEGSLLALWWDGRGDWEKAHGVAQEIDGPDGAWVHAYLHRKEGDVSNAGYWYGRAGQPVAKGELRAEWEAMVRTLLLRT